MIPKTVTFRVEFHTIIRIAYVSRLSYDALRAERDALRAQVEALQVDEVTQIGRNLEVMSALNRAAKAEAELAAARERAERAEAVLRWIADMGSVDGFVGASHAIEAVRMANEVLKGGEE